MSGYTGQSLSYTIEDGVVDVRLHQGPCNEIGTQMLGDLEVLATFLEQGADGASALILQSDIPAGFSAGADLRELHAGLVQRGENGGQDEIRGFIDRIHRVMNTLDSAPLTTIGVVHGVVFGGGFELALTCDILIAEKNARFCFPELRLGIIPGFGGIPRLKRDLGNAIVRDLLLSGRSIRASRAQEMGLVSQVVAKGRGHEVAQKLAQRITQFNEGVVQTAKAFIKPIPREALEQEKAIFCEMITQPEVLEALTAFVESTDVRPYLS
jgi:enoyl-CoA hydratase